MKLFCFLAAIALPLFVAADSPEGVLVTTNAKPRSDVCTYSPDTRCYNTGWPRCCDRRSGCSKRSDLSCDKYTGASICHTIARDSRCWKTGWPRCCRRSSGCNRFSDVSCDNYDDKPRSDVCSWGPDYSCYKTGWPRCCDRRSGCNKISNISCDKSTGFAGSLEDALDEQLSEFEANMNPDGAHNHDDDASPPHADCDDLRADFDRKHLRG
ncbi:hypothetical protein ACHAW5_006798 [Stephanodiscus triporus]|uniref:Uncharacterized protein n=1 Tax=Stephanodiscus triporus TaxID=2934178 RepID=A0ABD3R0X9_9STRA